MEAKMHPDVMEVILNGHIERMTRGHRLTIEEAMEAILLTKSIMYQKYEEMANTAHEFGQQILDMQTTRRICDLFLANHKLDEAFDNFEHRINRKRFGIK